MATAQEVAQMANVSVATVSRVLHNSNRVSEETRQRVIAAMEALSYENPRKSTKKKSVLVLCGAVIIDLLNGITDAAEELGYSIFVNYTMGQNVSFEGLLKNVVDQREVCGIITLGIGSDSIAEIEKINRILPIVQCCDELDIENTFLVATDDVAAACDMVTELLDSGRKRIGFFGIEKMLHPFKYSSRREIGYRRALEKKGIEIDPDLIKHADLTTEGANMVADSFLKMSDPPDAVFCVRDQLAISMINTLHEYGISVPQQIAVAGFGGGESSEECWPKLTTVVQSYYEIGAEALSLLHARISGRASLGRKVLITHGIHRAASSGL